MFALLSTVTEKSFSDDEVDYFPSVPLLSPRKQISHDVCASDDVEMM